MNRRKTKISITLGLLLAFSSAISAQEAYNASFSEKDIHAGYVIKKIPLNVYEKPQVALEDIEYTSVSSMPEDALPTSALNFDIILGKELKQPFALIRIPAYTLSEGKIQRVKSLTVNVNEQKTLKEITTHSAAKTTAIKSPLATGTWYKIAVAETGLYKIDYQFLTQDLGIAASAINPSTIRIFGNGGNMLPESNAVAHPEELLENAIMVNDGGDGSFDANDYIVFYAVGPTKWTANTANRKFEHQKNLYDDKGYYFINVDLGQPGKRVQTQGTAPTANVTVNSFDSYMAHEEDLQNPGRFGKLWWGEEFGISAGKQSTRSFSFDLGTIVDTTFIKLSLGSRSISSSNTFAVSINGAQAGSFNIGAAATHDDDKPVERIIPEIARTGLSGNVTVNLTYTPGINDGIGFLDYIEINARKALAFSGASLLFRDMTVVGAGQVASYQLGGASSNTQVWDVTTPNEPVRMNGALNGGTYVFAQNADQLHEFAAINGTQLPTPSFVSAVANQNLHGSSQVDFVIVAHPDFVSAAERLAQFHRDRSQMRVLVTTTTQVYNEFSSGGQDVSAIRDFVRMFYKRAGTNTADFPKYLLLMGDASYDYRDRIQNNTNFVPTFEASESFFFINTYSNDDFFAFLDDNENIEDYTIANTLDIGVGRIPAKSLQEANVVVDKILHYKTPATLGAWRLSATFIADDEDNAGPHMEDAEILDSIVQKNSNIYNATKVYQDALPVISTPGGSRAPAANKLINDAVFKGTLLMNYSGHGNTQVLSHERILTQDDYNSWKNNDRMPFMVTATCDYGQFDQPSYVSAGERVLLKERGGVIATLTTTHLVYQYANRILNTEFLNAQFEHVNGKWNTFGDAIRKGKNATYANAGTTKDVIINFRKFALLGDPALEPNFPQYFISTDSILDGASGKAVDTIGALGEYTVKGSVTDVNNNVLTNFNGNLSVTIFDKPRTVKTLTAINKTFEVMNNIIYRGKATVKDGHFSFAFIAPKDINYEFGKGKISYYAENGQTDGAGADTNYNVGGFSDNPRIENNPPIVKPYIGDSLFRNGGLTGPNTLLYAILEDETGINVSGNAIGHDLTAVLDGDISNPYILNDYYETEANTYKRGYLSFPVTGIPEGRHRFTVKAWDVNNNSGIGHVDFEVANGNIVRVQRLMNYPNPFSDKTHFVFEHNHPNEAMTVEINIYNTAGVIVKKILQDYTPGTSRSNEITWDATADNGAKLPSGVYVYRMKLSTKQRIEEMAYQKLVIVR
ncbi:MAG: type IX secretion system sortase PorU [Flavipsychrobacter sp.]